MRSTVVRNACIFNVFRLRMMPRIKLKYIYLLLVIASCSFMFKRLYYTDVGYPYDGEVQKFVEQIRNNEKPDVAPINVYKYKYLMDCRHKCVSGNVSDLRLVYIIKSAAGHFERRQTIRHSWGFESRFTDTAIRTVFVVGAVQNVTTMSRLRTEGRQHGDVVQADFIDTYFNNTIKTMMSIIWAVRFCPRANFYMFVDDDMYVSTRNVLRFVQNPVEYPWPVSVSEQAIVYAGHVSRTAPQRDPANKWHVPWAEYPWVTWPPFVSAGAYVLSLSALHLLHLTSMYTRHFRLDDVYLGLVAHKAHIQPLHCPHFRYCDEPDHVHTRHTRKLAYQHIVAMHDCHHRSHLNDIWNEQRQAGNA